MQIYIYKNNQQLGPFTEAEIKAQLASGAITPEDNVWWEGQATWVPLAQTPLAVPASRAIPAPAAMPMAPITAGAMAPQATSKLAIWSLVCGCLTLFCGLFASLPAIILGHLALGEIKKSPGTSGRGMALAGLIIGYIMTVLGIIGIAFYLMYLPQILKMAKDQQAMLAVPPVLTTTPDASTNSDQPTNAPDQSTNAPDSATNTPDQSTNAPATNSTDTSTTNAPSTNAADTPTNAAPMSQ